MEPCVVHWSPFTYGDGSAVGCRSRRPCAVVLSSLRRTVRPTRRGAWARRNYFCISRRNCCKTSIPGLGFKSDVCTLLLAKSNLGLPDWIRAGVQSDWRRAACVPVPAGQIQMFPGLWGSSVLQSWTFMYEKSHGLLLRSSQDALAQRCSGNQNCNTPWWPRLRNF